MANRKPTPARARPSTTRDDDDGDDDDALEVDLEPRPAPQRPPLAHAPPGDGDEIEELLDTLGANVGQARIIVHRVEPNKDPEECCDCPLTAFSKAQLRAEFGAGEYHCEVKTKGTIRRRWTWKFAKPVAPQQQQQAPAADQRALELERRLAELQAAQMQRSHDLVLALVGRPQPAAQGLTIADLAGFKEIFGGGEGKQSTLAAVKEIMEVADMVGGGGGGGGRRTGWADLALEGLKQLPEILQAGRADPRALPAPSSAEPQAPRAAAPVAPRLSARDQIVALLLEHANKGSSPELVGQFIYGKLEELPDDEFETACNFMESPGALSMAIMFESRLKPARAWLEQVLAQIRGHISRAEEEPGLTSGAGSGEAAGRLPD